ncbi:MAG: BrnT family toxin [Thermodesulfobacteriota bacterium]|nr:BrnT family toxin [Thermodesulfobacteriota bacterium]
MLFRKFLYDLHSGDEERLVLIGRSMQGRLLVIVHTERGDRIRIISARLATKKERVRYEENEE